MQPTICVIGYGRAKCEQAYIIDSLNVITVYKFSLPSITYQNNRLYKQLTLPIDREERGIQTAAIQLNNLRRLLNGVIQ